MKVGAFAVWALIVISANWPANWRMSGAKILNFHLLYFFNHSS
jgi:hypothetical protein